MASRKRMARRCGFLVGIVAVAVVAAAPAQAISIYTADLTPLNSSGVSGQAWFSLDRYDLSVRIEATGLEPNQPHPQHIHGRFGNGNGQLDSVLPTPDLDADGDGFVEVAEGAAAYGPVILPLTLPDGTFPVAAGGMLDFEQTYDLRDDAIFANDFVALDLVPLFFREVVLHGLNVPAIGAGTAGEVNGIAGYKPLLPVAAGEIVADRGGNGGNPVQPVPEPATLLLLGSGLAGLLVARRQRS